MSAAPAINKRQAWLDGLKVGDKVAIDEARYHSTPRIEQVSRRTPSGRITVGKRTFDPDGRERGRSYSGCWGRAGLIEPTQMVQDRIDLARIAEKFGRMHWATKPLGVLRQIEAILDAASAAAKAEPAG